LTVELATLATGDYSVKGLEHIVAIERKSLNDLLGCIGRERERFDREVQRMLAYPCRALVIEADWYEIETGEWRGEITPAQALSSLLSWMMQGIPVLMAGDHDRAGRYVARMLLLAARRRWRENRGILAVLDEPLEAT
jgi:ERCC4-type nuclease